MKTLIKDLVKNATTTLSLSAATLHRVMRRQRTAARLEDVQLRAYEIWLENGRRHGGHIEDWLQAKQELESQKSKF